MSHYQRISMILAPFVLAMACTNTPPRSTPSGDAGGSSNAGSGGMINTSGSGAGMTTGTGGAGGQQATCSIDNAKLADMLVQAMHDAKFEETVDFGPVENGACPGDSTCLNKAVVSMPNVDVAVIAFPDGAGCAPVYANVMLSRDFALGRVNTIEEKSLAVTDVRWRKWDIDRWNGIKGWTDNPALTNADDVVSGLSGADFFIPYPASTFKLLVAVQILRLVDQKIVTIDDVYSYSGAARTLRSWMEEMITHSDNTSTSALLQRIYELGKIADMNDAFAAQGLGTLRIDGTKADGTSWNPGQIHMGAWDTARLLWLLDSDAPAPSWTTPGGTPAKPDFLSTESKQVLQGFLRDQGWHEVLSTTSLCGIPKTNPGIPALLSDKWISANGSVTVEGIALTSDVKPCNDAATVFFDHKTGLTFNYGSDAGIVHGRPGKAKRHYIMAFFSNLGYRYTDADKLNGPHPCFNLGICYTQRIPSMAAKLDVALAKYLE